MSARKGRNIIVFHFYMFFTRGARANFVPALVDALLLGETGPLDAVFPDAFAGLVVEGDPVEKAEDATRSVGRGRRRS